ncbi:threonine-phosphate decarboxylase [Bacillus pakistanensis]|uniref:threonine-phosphate decarboxylase n=1 Tax=Rossellomorea pakistanensis TaxID=992288 RepID=A0ABS2N7K5_9BACI|nr:threonine-phosphate decarboxylase CobD [Bacillus pakistanensis]MBM7583836.1 threonine-phosphate decarboxylase [Bacillus pakistanensis]
MKLPKHGSNPQYVYSAMKMNKPDGVIDLSANINSFGPPNVLIDNWSQLLKEIVEYPDPYAQNLRRKISESVNVNVEKILVGNGGAELIHLIARMFAKKRILIVQPTFSEYENACRSFRCEIYHHQLTEPHWNIEIEKLKLSLSEMDALFLCNPTNPTGIVYSYETLKEIIEEAYKHKCTVIIDEAFYDFVMNYQSIVALLNEYENLIIIRSLTKMFSIPGIRLGYLMAANEIIQQLQSIQVHWSVNAIALTAGELLLEQEDFIRETQSHIKEEREALFSYFDSQHFLVSPSQTNFYLLRDPQIEDQFLLFSFLLEKGIVCRHTLNFQGLEGRWLRFAIKGKKEHTRLMEVMGEWRQTTPYYS